MTPLGRSIAVAPPRVLAAQLGLKEAWLRVEARAGMPGVDGIAVSRFAHTADACLRGIEARLARGEYKPLPFRLAEVEKKTGARRMLLVPAVCDRIVMTGAAGWIGTRLNAAFDDASFAYRAGLGVHDALRSLADLRRRGFQWVLDADIRTFFDSLDQTLLLDRLELWLGAGSPLLDWCRQWVRSSVWDGERLGLVDCGVAQGSPLSPVLANFYLHEFDCRLRAAKVHLVRYADDFLLLARTPFELAEARATAESALAGLRLELSPEKTRVASFDQGFHFLGAVIRGDEILLPFDKVKSPRKAAFVAPRMPPALLRAWRAGQLSPSKWRWEPHCPPEVNERTATLPRSLRALAGNPSLEALRRRT